MSFFTTDTGTTSIDIGSTNNHNYTWTTTNTTTDLGRSLDVNDIIVDGRSFKKFVENIEQQQEKINQRLVLLQPNPELEDRWNQLKAVREQYIKLEQEILEKERTLNILKSAK
jgi:hypothetical protein